MFLCVYSVYIYILVCVFLCVCVCACVCTCFNISGKKVCAGACKWRHLAAHIADSPACTAKTLARVMLPCIPIDCSKISKYVIFITLYHISSIYSLIFHSIYFILHIRKTIKK